MFKLQKRRYILSILAAGFIGAVLMGGLIFLGLKVNGLALVSHKSAVEMKTILQNYGKLPELREVILGKSIYKLEEEKSADEVYKALVASLGDPYSEYLNKKEAKEWEESLSGEFSGVGINFHETEEGTFQVVKTIEGSPAAGADVKEGDLILEVDHKTFDDVTKMAKAIRGKEGTKVVLTMSRDGEKKEIILVRAKVKDKTVIKEMITEDIGYIRISSFEDGTGADFESELNSLDTKGVKKLIIDLRGNGGGYTKEGIKIADRLLPEGTITYMEDKLGKKEYYNSDVKSTNMKYVLLVDRNTASTSEILAAAIKDNKGGPLVGEKTYGKGVVQSTYKFKDGSALKLTIMQYFSPKGETINKKGIEPDYPVALPEDGSSDTQKDKAVELLK